MNTTTTRMRRRLNQAELDLPVNVDGTPAVQCSANTCAITESGAVLDCQDARCTSPADRITAYVTTRGNTTYVTYTSDGLPLANLMRDILPFGDQIADLTEPLLKLAVDSAYYDGNPIPRDPSAYRPARFIPSPKEIISTVAKVPGAIQQGLTDAANPDNAPPTDDTSSTPESADLTFAPFGRSGTGPSPNGVRTSDKAVPGRAGLRHDTGSDLKAADASQDSVAGSAGEVAQTSSSAADSEPSSTSEDSPNDASGSES
jgi:YD repeat-containing protein